MNFKSLEFVIFFPVVVILYFSLAHRFRWILLLIASYYFYMCWKPEYALLLMFTTVLDYWLALRMGETRDKKKRKIYLLLSLISNLGMLFAFKYFNFLNDSLRAFCNYFNIFYDVPAFNVLLPVGISFYVFQSLSYTIDVYRGVKEPEKHLGIFALYVVFFPQLVAGPIERSTHLLPQFYEKHYIDYQRMSSGLRLIAWGFFKKIVIADRLALLVNRIYNNPQEFTGAPLILATVFFAFQIYCDFSGYTDIAIGSARVLGFDIMQNFRRPYFATSIREFWQRWHISLTTWFKDYLYIPLGGNRVSKGRWYFNLMTVFVLSGLWHGANWTFFIWGTLHGVYLVLSYLTSRIREKFVSAIGLSQFPVFHKLLRIFLTFSFVCFAWIFFRANTLHDALYIIRHLFDFSGTSTLLQTIRLKGIAEQVLGLSKLDIILSFIFIGILEAMQWYQQKRDLTQFLTGLPAWNRWAIYYAIMLSIICLGRFEQSEFIYFQF